MKCLRNQNNYLRNIKTKCWRTQQTKALKEMGENTQLSQKETLKKNQTNLRNTEHVECRLVQARGEEKSAINKN